MEIKDTSFWYFNFIDFFGDLLHFVCPLDNELKKDHF